jgi:HSP20 family molecular chaperone IbpA
MEMRRGSATAGRLMADRSTDAQGVNLTVTTRGYHTHHYVERACAGFERSFALPEDADRSKVNAEFKDGVLKIHLVKAEKAKPRTSRSRSGEWSGEAGLGG